MCTSWHTDRSVSCLLVFVTFEIIFLTIPAGQCPVPCTSKVVNDNFVCYISKSSSPKYVENGVEMSINRNEGEMQSLVLSKLYILPHSESAVA